ncbi:MAG: hypothetical protein C0603_09970 [Denitrovibrio sp.]|nr:MAG: hypothetical protein C0603_09970 [Denitrovibrio sp.]
MAFSLTGKQQEELEELSSKVADLLMSYHSSLADNDNRGKRVAKFKAELIKKIITNPRGHKMDIVPGPLTYIEDLFGTRASTHSMESERFIDAYSSAKAISNWGRDIRWRCYTVCWAAEHAMNIEGDFIEFGVDRGGLSTAVISYTNFEKTDKNFFLVDTYQGLVEDYISEKEQELNIVADGRYPDCWDEVSNRFSKYDNVKPIRGAVPDVLPEIENLDKVSYCSIDMNCAAPEVAALEYVWPKLSNGGLIIFDDYGFPKHQVQRDSLDEIASGFGRSIYTLPTGQGLLVK